MPAGRASLQQAAAGTPQPHSNPATAAPHPPRPAPAPRSPPSAPACRWPPPGSAAARRAGLQGGGVRRGECGGPLQAAQAAAAAAAAASPTPWRTSAATAAASPLLPRVQQGAGRCRAAQQLGRTPDPPTAGPLPRRGAAAAGGGGKGAHDRGPGSAGVLGELGEARWGGLAALDGPLEARIWESTRARGRRRRPRVSQPQPPPHGAPLAHIALCAARTVLRTRPWLPEWPLLLCVDLCKLLLQAVIMTNVGCDSSSSSWRRQQRAANGCTRKHACGERADTQGAIK